MTHLPCLINVSDTNFPHRIPSYFTIAVLYHVGLFLFQLQLAGITAMLEPRFTLSCNRFQLESVIATRLCSVKSVEIGSQRLILISTMIATTLTSQ